MGDLSTDGSDLKELLISIRRLIQRASSSYLKCYCLGRLFDMETLDYIAGHEESLLYCFLIVAFREKKLPAEICSVT